MSHARLFLLAGALSAALAVMLGAFGAHGLRARLPADLLPLLAADNPAGQAHLVRSLRTVELQNLPRTAPVLAQRIIVSGLKLKHHFGAAIKRSLDGGRVGNIQFLAVCQAVR